MRHLKQWNMKACSSEYIIPNNTAEENISWSRNQLRQMLVLFYMTCRKLTDMSSLHRLPWGRIFQCRIMIRALKSSLVRRSRLNYLFSYPVSGGQKSLSSSPACYATKMCRYLIYVSERLEEAWDRVMIDTFSALQFFANP